MEELEPLVNFRTYIDEIPGEFDFLNPYFRKYGDCCCNFYQTEDFIAKFFATSCIFISYPLEMLTCCFFDNYACVPHFGNIFFYCCYESLFLLNIQF